MANMVVIIRRWERWVHCDIISFWC